ncbi:MAG TPA: polyphosphate:AMP phosphotransferase [Isosphaeraceae bacterium]|jgi:polyphosphate:AMP phosphotransferase
MFEAAELGHEIDKPTYQREAPRVRAALLEAQRELAEAGFSVVVIMAGLGGAGKSETVNLLLEWLDARGIETHAMREPTDEERQRPPMWRFWRALPPRGRMGIFFGAWYALPILDRVFGRLPEAELDQALVRIVELESMLRREGVLVVKFWLHLSRPAQKKRLKALEADPRQRWRVLKRDWKLFQRYDEHRRVAEHVLRRTGTGESPWTIVEGTDRRYRHLTVAQVLLDALRGRLEQARLRPPAPGPTPVVLTPPAVNVLNRLDMTRALDRATYDRELLAAQGELGLLSRRLRKQERSLILVFEGPDAAGKGGAIRRLTAAMDARDYQVISVAAPTDEERAHPYLWRFWRHLPPLGRVTIYDRSWYGRVLVERVEGFARPDQWQRAYEEINAFEAQLTASGMIAMKFWLAITPDEQLRRFEDREKTPYKQYKLTAEDWRNRDRWASYEAAACDMIEKTGSEAAPWVLVEANHKEWARVKVLQSVIRHARAALA